MFLSAKGYAYLKPVATSLMTRSEYSSSMPSSCSSAVIMKSAVMCPANFRASTCLGPPPRARGRLGHLGAFAHLAEWILGLVRHQVLP